MPPESSLVEVRGVHRSYGTGTTAVHAVAGVDLDLVEGEVLALMGPSGCGKSTLLHLIGGLDRPDQGVVRVAGRDWAALHGRALAQRRRATCGFVFQNLLLLPTATAYENVEVPLLLAGVAADERALRVAEALEQVGLADQSAHLPDQLSGGQQQRVGIARALVHRPRLILADEPTGSLDSISAEMVTELLVSAAKSQQTAVVLVTHDPRVGAHADRILNLHSGLIDRTSLPSAQGRARSTR
ncbi:MAG: ABC transporter ATP-binding protein [Actinomycetota bacterium]|nr:ABC transporter ATP-binding protein [Actinomycetota bacterium]